MSLYQFRYLIMPIKNFHFAHEKLLMIMPISQFILSKNYVFSGKILFSVTYSYFKYIPRLLFIIILLPQEFIQAINSFTQI